MQRLSTLRDDRSNGCQGDYETNEWNRQNSMISFLTTISVKHSDGESDQVEKHRDFVLMEHQIL